MSTSYIIFRTSNQCGDMAVACRGALSMLWIEFPFFLNGLNSPLVTNIQFTGTKSARIDSNILLMSHKIQM